MSRIAKAALASLLTVSAAVAQEDNFGGNGVVHDPGAGGPDGSDLGAGGAPAGTDLFGSAARVSQYDGIPQGFFGPGSVPLSSSLAPGFSPAELRLSPGLQEATNDLLDRQYGINTEMLQMNLSRVDGPPPPANPDPGSPANRPRTRTDVRQLDPKGWRRRQGAADPWILRADPALGADPDPWNRRGNPLDPLISVPEPPVDLNWALVGPRRDGLLDVSDLRAIIDVAAADVLSNRLAREIDPNTRENGTRFPEERRTRGEIGLILLDLIDGNEASPQDHEYLRDHLVEVLSLLGAATREPRGQDGALQEDIEKSVRVIVDWIRSGIAR